MAYILESNIPENKSIYIALRYVYGIGAYKSSLICRKLGFSSNLKVISISSYKITQILKLVESLNFIVSSNLKKYESLKKQKLINIKAYRGLRRKKGFPVRGQRTHTNARTARKLQ